MAKLKPLKLKEKKFIFTAYENDRTERPAYAVFSCFPPDFAEYFIGDRKSLFDGAGTVDLATDAGKKAFVDLFLKQYLENIKNGSIDYERFLKDCVEYFGDFEYGENKIATVDDFLKLPETAVKKIAGELYVYAQSEDKFSMGE
jgi:hypothetical protein